jgi:hypothetical protein
MKLRFTLPTPKALTKFSMSFSISDECKQVIPKIYGQLEGPKRCCRLVNDTKETSWEPIATNQKVESSSPRCFALRLAWHATESHVI